MHYRERQRRFREHAAARLRQDTAETTRIEALIWPDLYLSHQLFVFSLFAAAVAERFGEDLDRAELAEFIGGLREARPGLHWLQAEALIRLCYGEGQFYLDVPQSEHPGLMWAVLAQLVPPDTDDAALTDLLDRADDFGRDVVADLFKAERLYGWADEPEPASGEPSSNREEPA